MGTALFMVIVILGFYLILLRPVLRQQRRQRAAIVNLKVGDEVLTQAGFIARVKEIRLPEEGPTEVILDLGSGLEVRALASAISQRLAPPKGQAEEENERTEEAGLSASREARS